MNQLSMDITRSSPLHQQTSLSPVLPRRNSLAFDMDMTFIEKVATDQAAAEIEQEIQHLRRSMDQTSVLMFDDDEHDDFHKSLDRITFENTSLDSSSTEAKDDLASQTIFSDQMEITHLPQFSKNQLETAKSSATAYEDGLVLNVPPEKQCSNARASLASRTMYIDQLDFTFVQTVNEPLAPQQQNHTIQLDQTIVDDSYSDACVRKIIKSEFNIKSEQNENDVEMNFTRMPDGCNEENASLDINETFHMRPGLCSTKIDMSSDANLTT